MTKQRCVRFDDEGFKKIEFIKEKTNKQSISSVLRYCVDKEYERLIKLEDYQ